MDYTGPERRRNGRPRIGEPVTFRLPDDIHDAICRIALRHGVSVSAVVRLALVRYASSVSENPSNTPAAPTL
jgi:hypothetical protein